MKLCHTSYLIAVGLKWRLRLIPHSVNCPLPRLLSAPVSSSGLRWDEAREGIEDVQTLEWEEGSVCKKLASYANNSQQQQPCDASWIKDNDETF